ncbi:MAG: response regulator receiver [Limisphaerales bacterium]|nr:MAG: response regulator receiver [Limisphaerales bacterium]KAG0509033.1 MAG: response regulator receiver [Limisphaerales bacterium]TXT46063.1 MAG: response regulator receiver [Limisphaerales bacterium]
MSKALPAGSRLHLPVGTEALRELRHDLRTPINAVIGYCEMLIEDAGAAAPAGFLVDLRRLHAAGRRMLRLTNELFSDRPSPLHQLTCQEVLRVCRTPASEVTTLCARLEQPARATGLPQAVSDLQRIAVATDRWRKRIEEMLAAHCR